MFSTLTKAFILSSTNVFNLDKSKILLFGRVQSTEQATFDLTNLRAFADSMLTKDQMIASVFHMIKTIVGKLENTGPKHFSPFPSMFTNTLFLRVSVSQDCAVKG